MKKKTWRYDGQMMEVMMGNQWDDDREMMGK